MSVLGFDIGNENCVIAAVKQRGIDVLLNDESKRETPGVVSFGEKQRFLGAAGAACATMNPRSTISQVKRLIGRRFDQEDVQHDLRSLPFETSEGPDGGILIHLQYLGERQSFTPVQILAMVLSHLKQTAEKSLGTQASDCVIGIPSYFTELQRRLYLDAAAIADLKPLRLLHDCTAIALGYGIYKTDFSSTGPTCVVFVDIGHSDTQVAVVSFEPGSMTVLSHAFDSNLGARDFDEVLFDHFATQFKNEYNIDVHSNTRACIRLRAACEKLKKVLSANPEAPLHIECLMEEKDVKGFIKRDEFESLSSQLLNRITTPCVKAINDAGVTLENIQSVELVGSGSRIPSISKILTSVLRREPSRTLNASECVARGCALQCAMLSPTFRVKDYEVADSLPFSIGLVSDGSSIQALPNGVLFPKGHPIPSDKIVALYKSTSFHLEAFYANQNELPPGISPRISTYEIGPFPVPHGENAKVKAKARLSINGTVKLVYASFVGCFADESALRNNAEMPSERMEGNNDDYDTGNSVEDRYSHPAPGSASYSNDGRGRATKRLDIGIKEIVYGGTTDAALKEAKEKEIELTQQDNQVELAKEKKNTLESYVYETRNKILNTYQVFVSESEKENISETLQQTEDWLYDEGDDESANVYAQRLQSLKKLVDPIENRYKEEEGRVLATRELLKTIEEYRAAARSLSTGDREDVHTECAKIEEWLQGKLAEQESMPKNVDPILHCSDIRKKADTLHAMCRHIMKPKGSRRSEDNPYPDQTRTDDMQVD